jgi:hypothetical protein
VVSRRGVAAQVAAVVLLLTACGGEEPSTTEEEHVDDRPAMETVVMQYEAMQDDLFASLEGRFGARAWAVSDNSLGGGRTGCDDDPEAERVYLPPMTFAGTYPEAEWDQVKQVVADVGREHGFDDVAYVKDEPGELSMVGEDAYGARYSFGMARNTVFDVHTGCHRWGQKPPPTP